MLQGALCALALYWSVQLLLNVIEMRKELTEIKVILNGCGCDELPSQVYESQVYEDYVPVVESLA